MPRGNEMTLAEAKAEVKSLGLKLAYDPEYQEYIVSIPGNKHAHYYTDDRTDAVLTARSMAATLVQKKGN